jgi:hypothetical protein
MRPTREPATNNRQTYFVSSQTAGRRAISLVLALGASVLCESSLAQKDAQQVIVDTAQPAVIEAQATSFDNARLAKRTPLLDISTAHHGSGEEQRKEQVLRLAQQYDLSKYTITRKLVIDRGAINHSAPVLTLNLRFLDNDDLALSAYVHEQGHWLLMERHRISMQPLYRDLEREFPNLDVNPPDGDGQRMSSYFHIVVCMLEWHALEDLIGAERARKVIEWKQGDHYTGIYKIDLNQREQVENIMKRYGIKW